MKGAQPRTRPAKTSSNLYSTSWAEVPAVIASTAEIGGGGRGIVIIEEAFIVKAIIPVSIEVKTLFPLKRAIVLIITLGGSILLKLQPGEYDFLQLIFL